MLNNVFFFFWDTDDDDDLNLFKYSKIFYNLSKWIFKYSTMLFLLKLISKYLMIIFMMFPSSIEKCFLYLYFKKMNGFGFWCCSKHVFLCALHDYVIKIFPWNQLFEKQRRVDSGRLLINTSCLSRNTFAIPVQM